jgi:hypothetical protein
MAREGSGEETSWSRYSWCAMDTRSKLILTVFSAPRVAILDEPLNPPDAFAGTKPMDLDVGFGTSRALYFNFNLPNSGCDMLSA